ncbi:MAG: hypothetical protein ACFB0C_09095, partial [Leptolyngbyaceae cyanobacterium]
MTATRDRPIPFKLHLTEHHLARADEKRPAKPAAAAALAEGTIPSTEARYPRHPWLAAVIRIRASDPAPRSPKASGPTTASDAAIAAGAPITAVGYIRGGIAAVAPTARIAEATKAAATAKGDAADAAPIVPATKAAQPADAPPAHTTTAT